MVEARATWVDEERFVGQASSGHGIVVDGAQVKSGNSPTELVLIGLCGCTAIDVVSILRKKREPFTSEARFPTKQSKTRCASQKLLGGRNAK